MDSVAPRSRSAVIWAVVVGVAMVGYAGLYSWQSSVGAVVSDVTSQDVPHAWQTVWNVAHGYGFRYTDLLLQKDLPRLSAHADYLLLLFVPLAWIWSSYLWLLIIQAVGVATGAWALWRIGRRVIGSPTAAGLLALSYLAYGPLQFAVTFQFHAVTLAVPLLLWAAEAILYRRRPWVVWLWFILALMTKEQVGLIAGPMLWWLARGQSRRRLGWWLLLVGLAWGLVHFFVIIPCFRSADNPHLFWRFYYGSLGSTPKEILPKLLAPAEIAHRLLTTDQAKNVLALLLPLGFLPLLNPLVLVSAAALLPHWLGDSVAVTSLYYHNHTLALPTLFLGTAFGIVRLRRWSWWGRWRELLTAAWVFGILLGSVMFSPNPWSMAFLKTFYQHDPRVATFNALARRIPPGATVAVSWGIPPMFRDHPTVYVLPAGVNRAEYVVVGTSALDLMRAYAPHYASDLFSYFDASQAFEVVERIGDIALYRHLPNITPEPLPPGFVDPTLNRYWK